MSQDSADEFKLLEIHDSDIRHISADQTAQGDWKLTVTVNIDSTDRKLMFENCRAISTSIHGGMAIGDVVDKHLATRDSDIFRNADKWPSPLSKNARHYSITTNSGSRLDVVAESFELGGCRRARDGRREQFKPQSIGVDRLSENENLLWTEHAHDVIIRAHEYDADSQDLSAL